MRGQNQLRDRLAARIHRARGIFGIPRGHRFRQVLFSVAAIEAVVRDAGNGSRRDSAAGQVHTGNVGHHGADA